MRAQTPSTHKTFGAFSDCTPDRWGRRLILRSERRRVEDEGGAQRSFGEIDYLLGVRNDLRQGALRFRDPDTGVFVADEQRRIPRHSWSWGTEALQICTRGQRPR